MLLEAEVDLTADHRKWWQKPNGAGMLDADDLATVAAVLRGRGPGRYVLRELYGDQWQFQRPRWLGRRFKKSVLAGFVPGVRSVGQKSNKSQVYGKRSIDRALVPSAGY